MPLTLRQLEALLLVHRLGSLTKAAAELGVTQSAMSLIIRQTEDALGLRLFDRTTRALRPTTACLEAVTFAERIVSDARGLARHMRDLKDFKAGQISIAVSAGVAFALPRVLTRYIEKHPDISVNLFDMDPDDLPDFIKSGQAEFGIGNLGILNDPQIKAQPLLHSPLSAIGLRDGKFETRRHLRWEEMKRFSVIAMRPGTRIRAQIDDDLARAGHEFKPTLEVSLVTTSLALTAEGAGVSVLPAHMLPVAQFPNLVALPLIQPTINRHLSVIRRAEVTLSPAARAFLEIAREIFQNSPSSGPRLPPSSPPDRASVKPRRSHLTS